MRIVVMGVSGSGKSTVGKLLAQELGLAYMEGDDLHPRENVEKMASGKPLSDEDRWPWLEQVALAVAKDPAGLVIGCSALKRSYRDLIRRYAPGIKFVHLHGSYDLLYSRMAVRPGHFMPASLLQSQFDTLEQLGPDEDGAMFDVANPPEQIVADAVWWIMHEN